MSNHLNENKNLHEIIRKDSKDEQENLEKHDPDYQNYPECFNQSDRHSFCLLRNSIIKDNIREILEKKDFINEEISMKQPLNDDIIKNDMMNILEITNSNLVDKTFEKKENQINEIINEINTCPIKKEIININKLPSYEAENYLRIEENDFYQSPDDFIEQIKIEYEFVKDTFESMLITYDEKPLHYLNYLQKSSIGPLQTLDDLIVKTTKVKNEKEKLDNLNILESLVFMWRSVSGDGNCFYRAFIFSYLEGIILEKNIDLFRNELIDFYLKLNIKHEGLNELSKGLRENILRYKSKSVFYHLLTILELLAKGKADEKYFELAYDFLMKSINFSKDFDYVN